MSEKIDIEKLSGLAKLKLTEDEKAELSRDLEELIGFASTCIMSKKITVGEPDFHGLAELREDNRGESAAIGELLMNSPAKGKSEASDRYFVVPRAVEG